MKRHPVSLQARIGEKIAGGPPEKVWTPSDFAYLGSRAAVDKALQRLTAKGSLRRIDRGLYDQPRTAALTGRPVPPDYRQVLDAIARRDQVRLLIDGMTAANDLGLTTAVPSRVPVYTDARRADIQVGNLLIQFKRASPRRLYWAGRPAMRVVQALHWLKDTLPGDRGRVIRRLRSVVADPQQGPAIRRDLVGGMAALPDWMRPVVRDLLDGESSRGAQA